jgi:hypothetical protein
VYDPSMLVGIGRNILNIFVICSEGKGGILGGEFEFVVEKG